MNNIGVVNIIILKQPIVEKVKNNYKSHIYPISAFTQS